jgi:hypothetical protein
MSVLNKYGHSNYEMKDIWHVAQNKKYKFF